MAKSIKTDSTEAFSGWRRALWPIHGHELYRVLPIFLISLLLCFNYSLIRTVKDTLVINAIGAELIPFLKVWGILPGAILSTYLFTRLSGCLSRNQVFYIVVGSFLFFFTLFALAYPQIESFHLHGLADSLEASLPSFFHWPIAMLRYWSLSAMYIISELWATIVMGVLFWGFANEITPVDQAKRFYGVIGVGSNLAAAMAGVAGTYLTLDRYNVNLPFGANAWEQSILLIIGCIVTSGLLAMALYCWVSHKVLSDEEKANTRFRPKEKKARMGFVDSLRFLRNSPYLMRIAVVVVGYSLVINLMEIVWKGQAKILYPSKTDLNAYLFAITFWVGMVSSVAAISMPYLLRKLGWTGTALLTPIIVLTTGLVFFGALFAPTDIIGGLVTFLGLSSPLALVVGVGGVQNALSKASKYSAFDTTKELAFIPLDREEKMMGKASIDGIGSRLGKFGGSLIQQGLIVMLESLTAMAPYVGIFAIGASVIWVMSILSVGKTFNKMTGDPEIPKQEPLPSAV